METVKAEQDIAVSVAAVAHCALQSLLQDTALPVGLRRVPVLSTALHFEVAIRSSEKAFYMRLLDIHALKTLEQNADGPVNLLSVKSVPCSP